MTSRMIKQINKLH